MAVDMNSVTISGVLVDDAVLDVTAKGTPVVRWRMLNRFGFYDRGAGEYVKRTTMVKCAMFGKTAKKVGRHFMEGRHVVVQGRLRETERKETYQGERLYVLAESAHLVYMRKELDELDDPGWDEFDDDDDVADVEEV